MEHAKKNHHIFSIKELNQLRANSYTDEQNVDQQPYELVTRRARAMEPECDRLNLSAPSPY